MIEKIRMLIMERQLQRYRRKQVKQMLACFDRAMAERRQSIMFGYYLGGMAAGFILLGIIIER